MKKTTLKVSAIFLSCAILFSSCIGSFALTNKVKDWNMNIGGKHYNNIEKHKNKELTIQIDLDETISKK